jgi:hypothetical protein
VDFMVDAMQGKAPSCMEAKCSALCHTQTLREPSNHNRSLRLPVSRRSLIRSGWLTIIIKQQLSTKNVQL